MSVVMAVALVSTPKVWQKFNELLAAVQHQAQSKLLNVALNSQAEEYDESVLTPIAQTEQLASSCPNSQHAQVAEAATRRSAFRQVRAKGRDTSLSSTEHAALAFNARPEIKWREAVPSTEDALARGAENLLKMHGVNALPPQIAMSPGSIVEVVMLPRPEQPAPIYFEKDADLNFKLKKAFEETKAVRQKARFVMGRTSLMTLPSS